MRRGLSLFAIAGSLRVSSSESRTGSNVILHRREGGSSSGVTVAVAGSASDALQIGEVAIARDARRRDAEVDDLRRQRSIGARERARDVSDRFVEDEGGSGELHVVLRERGRDRGSARGRDRDRQRRHAREDAWWVVPAQNDRLEGGGIGEQISHELALPSSARAPPSRGTARSRRSPDASSRWRRGRRWRRAFRPDSRAAGRRTRHRAPPTAGAPGTRGEHSARPARDRRRRANGRIVTTSRVSVARRISVSRVRRRAVTKVWTSRPFVEVARPDRHSPSPRARLRARGEGSPAAPSFRDRSPRVDRAHHSLCGSWA